MLILFFELKVMYYESDVLWSKYLSKKIRTFVKRDLRWVMGRGPVNLGQGPLGSGFVQHSRKLPRYQTQEYKLTCARVHSMVAQWTKLSLCDKIQITAGPLFPPLLIQYQFD